MTVSVMVTGSLFRSAVQKTAKSGKLYTTATLKSVAGSEVEFWSALAFGETEQTALLGLAEGEKCAVQGSMKLEAKAGDGEVKIYRTVFVDALLALKPAPRERKPSNAAAKRDTASAPHAAAASAGADPSDDIPF
jgi:hypothetical protein